MAEKSRWSLGAKLKVLFARSDADETVDDIFDDVPSLPRNEEVEREVAPEPLAEKPKAEKKPKPDKVAEPVVEPIAHKVVETKPEPVVTPAEEPEEVLPEPVAEVLPEPTPEPEVVAESEPEPDSEPVQEVLEEKIVEEPAPAPVVAAKPEKAKPVAKAPRRAAIDEDMWEELEETLLAADFGPDITDELIQVMRTNVAKFGTTDPEDFIRLLREAIEDRLNKFDTTLKLSERPAVILVVGVNGVGKTTTIGKLANWLSEGEWKVFIGAADTFRAAAVDQVATWADRAGATLVRPKTEGQDPASVAFESVEAAIKDDADIVIIDTAGRLQNKTDLMGELDKIRRVIEKQAKISEVLLVLDATTGQNGMSQAKAFAEIANVTGVVLTKLDGTAKGGIVYSIQRELGIPVKLVGVGEGINDFAFFDATEFARGLVS
mgnify:CR=1 FL=1